MLVKEFLEVVYYDANIRIIRERDEDLDTVFNGVRNDVPEELKDRKIDFINADMKVDIRNRTTTAGIKIFLAC